MNDYDRVTDVLKFCSGMDKIPDFILSNAADRGKAVHESCESLIKGLGEMPIKPEWQGYVDSFKKWYDFESNTFMPERLFCDIFKCTGLIDFISIFEGKYYLYDLKTSAQENLTWKLQLSAYTYLVKVCLKIDIEKMYVVMLKKDGSKPEVKEYENEIRDFISCLDVYRMFFKSKKPEIDVELI